MSEEIKGPDAAAAASRGCYVDQEQERRTDVTLFRSLSACMIAIH